jgi:hypothetical protein
MAVSGAPPMSVLATSNLRYRHAILVQLRSTGRNGYEDRQERERDRPPAADEEAHQQVAAHPDRERQPIGKGAQETVVRALILAPVDPDDRDR